MCAGRLVAAGPVFSVHRPFGVTRTDIRSCTRYCSCHTRAHSLSLSLFPPIFRYITRFMSVSVLRTLRACRTFLPIQHTFLKKKKIHYSNTHAGSREVRVCRMPTCFSPNRLNRVSRGGPGGPRFRTFYFWHVTKRRRPR